MDFLYVLMPISGVTVFWPGLVILGLGVGVIGGNITAHTEFGAAIADDDLAVKRARCAGGDVQIAVRDRFRHPQLLAVPGEDADVVAGIAEDEFALFCADGAAQRFPDPGGDQFLAKLVAAACRGEGDDFARKSAGFLLRERPGGFGEDGVNLL